MAFDHLALALKTISRLRGVPVVYRRGNQWVTLTAIPGQISVEKEDTAIGGIIRGKVLMYLLPVEELRLDGLRIEPAKGDRIEETQCGQRITYEVLPLAKEAPGSYFEHGRNWYRVHPKQIGSDEVP